MKQIELYTDGSCRGNPGPGGYGIVLRFTDSKGELHEKQLSGGYGLTTNNRMELLAAIVGLESLKEPCRVRLYSDSSYLINAYEKHWIDNWKRFGWFKNAKKKEAVKNADLWKRLEAAKAPHELEFIWVKGHADNELNNLCDEMAVAAATAPERYLANEFMEPKNQETISIFEEEQL